MTSYEKKKLAILISYVLTSVFLLVFNSGRSIKFAKDFIAYLVSPAPSITARILHGTGSAFRNAGMLLATDDKNRQLNGKMKDMALKYMDYDELKLENDRLRAIMNFQKTVKIKFMPASIIGQIPSVKYDGFIIDKGVLDGVENDMAAVVCSSGNVLGLAGRVAEAGERTSKILLVNDVSCEVTAMTQRSREQGIVSGFDGNSLVMKYLSPQADVEKGDYVITSGLGGIFPKGLRIGRVESVQQKKYAICKEAILKPEVNVRKAEELLIIKYFSGFEGDFSAEKKEAEGPE